MYRQRRWPDLQPDIAIGTPEHQSHINGGHHRMVFRILYPPSLDSTSYMGRFSPNHCPRQVLGAPPHGAPNLNKTNTIGAAYDQVKLIRPYPNIHTQHPKSQIGGAPDVPLLVPAANAHPVSMEVPAPYPAISSASGESVSTSLDSGNHVANSDTMTYLREIG